MPNPLPVVVCCDVRMEGQNDPSQRPQPLLRFSLSVGTPGEIQLAQSQSNGFAFWVLDRASPASGAKWKFVSQDPNSVPDGIQPYMDDGHIVVFSCLATYIDSVPQGPLYAFLMNNGAGAGLRKIEALHTCLNSGVSIDLGFSYTLVSIPGAAVPAIEDWNYWVKNSSSNALPVTTFGSAALGSVYARTDAWVAANKDRGDAAAEVVTYPGQPFNQEHRILVFDLIPAADGRYMPVRMP
jgi:hypothetical protein